MNNATTFLFQEVFPDYETWQSFITKADIVNYSDPGEAAFDAYCFKLLSRKYRNNNIRYLDPNDFSCELANIYENHFNAFKKRKELIDGLYNLTLDEITEVSKAITNIANNPNNTVDDPSQPLDFISGQTYQIAKNGRINSYLQALDSIPDKRIDDFLSKFKYLFMVIQPNNIYIY